ncbi:Protease HtpX [bacterium HR37]|nr:Protease HtpX [bacterium HR37]
MNTIKTLLFLALLSAILIWAGGAIGGKNGALVALIIAGVMNLISFWWSDKIVIAMYRGREIGPEDYPQLYEDVRELAGKAGIPMPKLYLIPEDTPNAFATGRSPNHAAVAVTRGILRLLNREELKGVIAHELAHIKNRDILIGTIAATIAGAISYLAYMAQWVAIFGGRGRDRGNILTLLVMVIVAPLAALLIRMAISRAREYMADEVGARICGNPLYLASALRKLGQVSGRIPLRVNEQTAEATAHMFIVNPLTGKGFETLFSTHPPIEERIARLENMARRQI